MSVHLDPSLNSSPSEPSVYIPPARPNSPETDSHHSYSPHVYSSRDSTPASTSVIPDSSPRSVSEVFAFEYPPHPAVLRLIWRELEPRPDSPPDPRMLRNPSPEISSIADDESKTNLS